MKVLVCGGRAFDDKQLLFGSLDRLHAEYRFDTLIHGAARGADTLADAWARSRAVRVNWYRAEWKKYGNKIAGPIRNKRMLVEGRPNLVIAFKGGKGTANMIKQAEQAGIQVIRIAERPLEIQRH